jgi:hypothetical protein
MTKVSVFGQQPTETKELKKIEFVKVVNGDSVNLSDVCKDPNEWDNVILIEKGYSVNFDLIYAHNNGIGCAYLGHWNDGVV